MTTRADVQAELDRSRPSVTDRSNYVDRLLTENEALAAGFDPTGRDGDRRFPYHLSDWINSLTEPGSADDCETETGVAIYDLSAGASAALAHHQAAMTNGDEKAAHGIVQIWATMTGLGYDGALQQLRELSGTDGIIAVVRPF
jgi:hypothetical protein